MKNKRIYSVRLNSVSLKKNKELVNVWLVKNYQIFYTIKKTFFYFLHI